MRTRANLCVRLMSMAAVVSIAAACADVTISPGVPASIELTSFPAPAIVIGDTLRDSSGVVAPVRAVVRDQQGQILPDADVRFVYADGNRDTSIFVDSATGFVVSLKALPTAANGARIAARSGANLQVIRSILVTLRPDSMGRTGSRRLDTLKTTLPDTGSTGVAANTSGALSVTVHHIEAGTVTLVPNWLVRYELLRPANPNNDSTAAVFLVNDAQRVSNIDTTNTSGSASRFVRVRSSKFPAGSAADSAIVRVTVSYRGKPVKGAPDTLVVPIIRKP